MGPKKFFKRKDGPTETKPIPPDGIFLHYGLNPETWETFSFQYLARVRSNFGHVYQEIEQENEMRFDLHPPDDLDEENEDEEEIVLSFGGQAGAGGGAGEGAGEGAGGGEPLPPPKKKSQKKKKKAKDMEYKELLRTEQIKLNLKEERQLKLDRERFIGDLFLHISQASERHLREHELFYESSRTPHTLWVLLRLVHMAPTHAGNLDLIQARNSLYSCKQGTHKIEDHARRFRLLYERVTSLGNEDCGISEKVAAEIFITSLRADHYGSEVARWMREGKIPDNLEETQRMAIHFWQTSFNAMKALDGGGRSNGNPRGEAVFQATGGKFQKKPQAQKDKELQICPICGKKSAHKPAECWELDKFVQKHREKKPDSAPSKFKGKKNHGGAGGRPSGQDQDSESTPKSDPKSKDAKPTWTILLGGKRVKKTNKVYLDSGATISIWNTKEGLRNIQDIDHIHIAGVSGRSRITKIGTHPVFGQVHILESCPVNLLAFKDLRERFDIHYSPKFNGFKLVANNTTIYFDSDQDGLYELRADQPKALMITEADTEDPSSPDLDIQSDQALSDSDLEDPAKEADLETQGELIPPDNPDASGDEVQNDQYLSDLDKDLGDDEPIEPIADARNTIEEILDEPIIPIPSIKRPAFTPEETKRAEQARRLCRLLGHVGDESLIRMIKSGACLNTPVTEADVRRANAILGPCLGCSLGKTTKRRAKHIPVSATETAEPRPEPFKEQLHADFVFLPGPSKSKQIVMLSVGKSTRLLVACRLETKTSIAVSRAWDEHLNSYRLCGAQITRIYTDNEATLGNSAAYLASRNPPVELVQHGSDMHEPFVERRVRTIKERMRSTLAELPYQLPARLYWFLMAWVIQGINIVPDTLTPEDQRSSRELVSGIKTDLSIIDKACFGDIVQYHVSTSEDLNLAARNQVGIIVGRNLVNGVFRIWDINIKSLVKRVPFIHLKPNELIIGVINKAAKQDSCDPEKMITRLGARDNLVAKPRESYRDLSDSDEDDSDYVPGDEDEDDDDDDDDDDYVSEDDSIEEHGVIEDPKPPDKTEAVDKPKDQPRTSTRPNRGLVHLARVVFTQLTIKTAIADYGSQATSALLDEFNKMRLLNVFHPVPLSDIPKGETIIPSSIFIKVKTKGDGEFDKIRARMVAGGHKQEWNELDECSSPTAAWEAVLSFWATCAQNNLHILSGDVPSAYLHASREGLPPVFMRIGRDLTDIVTQAHPELKRYVNKDGTITVVITKAMYGLKESGLLWNQNITATLSDLGFTQLKQDRCVFVKVLEGKLKAILVIYVDDVMLAGKDLTELNAIFDNLESKYGSLSRSSGPEFSFLGTSLTNNPATGVLSINCLGFIEKLCKAMDVTETSDNPHLSNFTVKDKISQRDTEPFLDNHAYRSLVMSLLYVAKRVRPDILFVVSHLSTRQVNPTVKDWKAAIKALKYLHGTSTKGITFRRDSTHEIMTYADAAFNVHPDSKSHSGIIIFLSGGPVHFRSSKQKLVTKSTTEAELVAFDDALDMTMWISEICQQIGYRFSKPCLLFQDNQSAIHILNQGRMVKKRGNIGIRFEYILEQLKLGTITVSYVRTENMRADLMTKALHGTHFTEAVSQVLG